MAKFNPDDILEISDYNPPVTQDKGWQNESSGGLGIMDAGVGILKGIHSGTAMLGDLGLMAVSGAVNNKRDQMVAAGELSPDEGRLDANKVMRQSGHFNPEAGAAELNRLYSKDTRESLQNVENAEGFWDTLVAYAKNPRAALAGIAESAPLMLPVFGAAGRAYKAAEAAGLAKGLAGKELENYIKRRVMVASGAAEGAVSSAAASQAIGQDNLENSRDYSEGQGWALPIGVTTGVIGQLNPMEANIMTKGLVKGVLMKEAIKTGQPVSMLKSAGGALGRAGMSAVKEGGEEVAQGVFETGFTNLGQKKEFMDDQGKSAAENFVVGGAMGVGMHPFTNGGFRRGNIEQAINNDSSQQTAEEAAARPKTELNPEEQSQIAQATTDAQNPNAQVQQPVETQQPTMSPEEIQRAQMDKEDDARRQAVIDRYGLEFNRRHGKDFVGVTSKITDEAEKDFHAMILRAAGEMGINNPFKEEGAATTFADEYRNLKGDKQKLAEFYRNIGIKAENDAGKKQGALRQAEFYQQLADLLEGGELLNFEQRRARKEEKKAAQAAEIQAAQVQQTAEQMMAQEPAPVETKPEGEAQPVPKAKPEVVITAEEQKLIDSEEVPTGDALGILSPSQRKRVYEAHVDKLVAAGKIGEAEAKAKKVNFPMRDKGKSEQKFVTLWNLQHKRSWGLADQEKAEKFRARLAYIKKADLGIASGINTVSNKLEDIIAKRDPNKLDEFISKNENRIQAKIRLKNAINDGVSEERVALIRKLAEAAKTEEDWAGVNKDLMDEGASDTLGVAPKETVVKTNKDGVVEVDSKDTKASFEEYFILRDQAREKLDRLLENPRGSYKKDLKGDEFDKIGLKREDALTNAEEEAIVRLGTDEDKAKLQQLLFKDQTVDIAQRRDENLTKQSKENEDKFNRRMGYKLTPEEVEEAKKKEEKLKKAQAQAREKRGELYRENWNELDDGEKLLVAQTLSIAHENLPTVSGKRTGKTDKILGAVLRDKEKRDQFKAIAVEELGKKGEAVSSGTSDTVYSAQANLDAHGKSIPRSEASSSGQLDDAGQIKTSAIARDQNVSELVKIIADQKLLFKGDELKARKASKSSLTEKQKKQNYNDVRNGLNKSWGVSTTKELLDSGKVVICDSNEGFIDTIVKDYLAKDPSLSEEEVRNTLREEGYDRGTNALYDENTGKVYINGENVDENEAGSVLAHEIGVHAAKDSEFKELVKDIEDRVATLMAEGLKSKNPAVKKFWEDVKRRMDDADVSDNEERLAYFLEVYVKRNGVIPQSIQSEMYQAIGQLKDWLLKFLGIKSINEHKAAELLCDVVRAYADQSAMEKGGGRHASKKGKNDKPKKPRKQLTPEEKEKKKQEKLAGMTPSQRASYERQQKRAELNRKIKKQQDERVGKAEMEKTEAAKNEAKAVETGGFKKRIEDTFTGKAAPIGDAILWIGEVGAKLNNKLFKFTDRLVDELSKFAPSAKGYYQKLIDHAKGRAEYQAKSAAIYENWQKLKEEDRKAVDKFLFDSASSGLWGYIPADWTDMDGKAIPEETFGQVDAHMAKQFESLSPEAQAVVQQVFKYGHDTMILKQKLYDLMGQALQGKGYVSPFKSPKSVLPYSPLRRTGTYNVVWVSPELKEARGKLKALQDKYTSLKENDKDEEQVATRNAKLGASYAKEAVDKLERSAGHYYVGRFEYFTDARQAVRDLKAEHPGNDAVMYEIGTEEGLKSLTSTAEVNEMTANLITAVEKNYGPVSKAMKQSILEMTMDAAQKKVDASMRKRRNIAGANPNMMDSFLHQGQTDSWLLSNMQYGKQISDAFQKVKTETKDYREGPEEGKATVGDMQALYNELQARHQRMMERHNHNAWDTFSEWARTSNTALTLSFKPMFYVQNALQPWMMTAPWLAGQFGGYKTQTAMAKAYGEWGTMFNAAMKDAKTASEKFHAFGNLSKQIEDSKLPLEEKAMLKEMMSRNLLDLGAQQDFGNVTGRSAISKAINKTMVEISVAARGVELLNRYVTAVSGFRLKKAELMGKGKTESEAVQGATEYAADLLSMTQGDYSALNAPDWFNTRPGKFMLQFRKFQAIQLNFFKQMLKNSFDKNMSKEERAAARRQLTWALGTHFAMAGVKGLPAVSATLALLSSMRLLGDDDEDEETALRRHLAEAGVPVEFQDLMLEGLPSFLGWNLSDSVGAGTMLSAAPYRREDLFSKDGFREAIWNLGGAPLGRAERIWKGFFDSNWEHQRPFWEAVLPAGIPSALKAAGIFDPTEDKKTGAKMLNDDEISFGSRALMMLGATPKSVERMYKMRNQAFRTQEYIKEEKGDLTRRWIDAMKNRDYKAQSEIRKELPELNRKRRAKGFKPVSMNDLMTAWKTRQKEEKLMQKNHGLKLPNSQQGFAKQLNKIYN